MTLDRLKKYSPPHVHSCYPNRQMKVADCHAEGRFQCFGKEVLDDGTERPLGMCRTCHIVYPLDVFEKEE